MVTFGGSCGHLKNDVVLAAFHKHVLSKRVLSSAFGFNNKSTVNLYIVERANGVKRSVVVARSENGNGFLEKPLFHQGC